MAKTFSVRRSFILNEASTIVDVREKYPFLFSLTGVADKFYNLTEYNLDDKFDEGHFLILIRRPARCKQVKFKLDPPILNAKITSKLEVDPPGWRK